MQYKNVIKFYAIIVALAVFGSIFTSFLDTTSGESPFAGLAESLSLDYARITDVEYVAVFVDEPIETQNDNKNTYPYYYDDAYYYNDYQDKYAYSPSHGEIGSQSRFVVTETVTFDVRAASKNNLFWELWLGLGEEEIEGIRRTYKVNSVKQVMPDGTKVEWEEAPQLYWDDSDYISSTLGPNKWFYSMGPYNESGHRYECLMLYVDGLYREKIKFEIEYEVFNVVLKYNDCSELYLPMYDGESCKYLESFKGEIIIPNKDMPQFGNYEATGFGTKNGTFKLQQWTSDYDGYTSFSFDLKEEDLKFLNGYEYLEFDMYAFGEDKHIFADYATENDFTEDDAIEEVIANRNIYINIGSQHKTFTAFANIIVIVFGVILLLFAFLKLSSAKRKWPIGHTGPNGEYIYKEIPSNLDPKFAAELVFCKTSKQPKNSKDSIYASLLLSLARKKYIELDEFGNDTLITILPSSTQPISNMYAPQQQQNAYNPNHKQGYNSYYNQNYSYNYSQNYNYSYNSNYNPNYNTTFQTPTDKEYLTYCEHQYFSLLNRHATNGRITITELEKRIARDTMFSWNFQKKIDSADINRETSYAYTSGKHYKDVSKSIKNFGIFYIVLGALILTFGNFISSASFISAPLFGCFVAGILSIATGIFVIKRSVYYVQLTQFGEQEYQKWVGLYNFLKSDTLLTERTYVELPLWEQYLVYATAFGISEKVTEAIRIRCTSTPPQTSITNHSRYNIHHIRTRSTSVGRSIRTSSHSYHASRYGGSYSAGGRGVGGGGGGH